MIGNPYLLCPNARGAWTKDSNVNLNKLLFFVELCARQVWQTWFEIQLQALFGIKWSLCHPWWWQSHISRTHDHFSTFQKSLWLLRGSPNLKMVPRELSQKCGIMFVKANFVQLTPYSPQLGKMKIYWGSLTWPDPKRGHFGPKKAKKYPSLLV